MLNNVFFPTTTQLQLPAPHPPTPSALRAQPASCPPIFHTSPLFSTTQTGSKAPPARSPLARTVSNPSRKVATPLQRAPLASTWPPPPPPPLTSPGPETRELLRSQRSSRSRPPPTLTPDRQGAPATEGTQTSSRCGRAR